MPGLNKRVFASIARHPWPVRVASNLSGVCLALNGIDSLWQDSKDVNLFFSHVHVLRNPAGGKILA